MAHHFYCLCHKDEVRKAFMKESFERTGLSERYTFYDGVSADDPRFVGNSASRAPSMMFGHLELIDAFYRDENATFGIFCENDVMLHKDIASLLPRVLEGYTKLKLNVLLLGCLLPDRLAEEDKDQQYPVLGEGVVHGSLRYTFRSFPEDLWGAQMYVLSKESAKILLDKYGAGSGYYEKSLTDGTMRPFSPDWTLTKDGNRALIYPMLAVENDRVQIVTDVIHATFHKKCFRAQFEEGVFC